MDPASPQGPEQEERLPGGDDDADGFADAAKVAAFNGWTIGFLAVASLLFGFYSRTSLIVGIGLAIVARNEFKGRAALRVRDPAGLELLWRNQLGFMGLIIAYCLWSMYRTVTNPSSEIEILTQLLGEGAQELVQRLTLEVYAVVIAGTCLFQGLNARYYFVRLARLGTDVGEAPSRPSP